MISIFQACLLIFPPHLPNLLSIPIGTRGFESEEKDRPQFEGDKVEPLRRSFVTNRKETYYPQTLRTLLRVRSFFAIVFTILLILAFFGAIFYTEHLVIYKYPAYKFRFFDWIVAIFIAIMVEVFSHYYLTFSTFLADNENHQTETKYEDSLISKTLFFKIFNHYGPVIFTVFGKGPLLGTKTGTSTPDIPLLTPIFCMPSSLLQLQLPGWFLVQLISIINTRYDASTEIRILPSYPYPSFNCTSNRF